MTQWCRCGAHLVESSDDQTPDELCCVCVGKTLRRGHHWHFAVGYRHHKTERKRS